MTKKKKKGHGGLKFLVFLVIVTYWPPLSLFLPQVLGMRGGV